MKLTLGIPLPLAISAVSVDWRSHQLDHMTLYQKVSGSYITHSTYDRSYDVIYCPLLSRATTGLCFNFVPYMEVYNHTHTYEALLNSIYLPNDSESCKTWATSYFHQVPSQRSLKNK